METVINNTVRERIDNLTGVRPPEPRLKNYFNIIKAFNSREYLEKYTEHGVVSDLQLHEEQENEKYHIREFIRENHKIKYARSPVYEKQFEKMCKTKGKKIKKQIATIKNLKTRHIDSQQKDQLSTVESLIYLKTVSNFYGDYREKLEPTIYSHHWCEGGVYRTDLENRWLEGLWCRIDWHKIVDHDMQCQNTEAWADYWIRHDTYTDKPTGTDSNFQAKLEHLFELHQTHQSLTRPLQIAYYPTLEHLRSGREVVTRLGKYLTKYAFFIGISEVQIKSIVDRYQASIKAREGWTVDILIGDTNKNPTAKQDFISAYSMEHSEVGSCMKNKKYVDVYAYENSPINMAILQNREGMIIARTLLRDDEHKGHVRLYPSKNEGAEGQYLHEWIHASEYHKQRNLEGLYLDCYDEHGHFIHVPYVDCIADENGDASVYGRATDYQGRLFLHINEYADRDDVYLQTTDGYGEEDEDEYSYCDFCGNDRPENEVSYVETCDQSCCDDCWSDEIVEANSIYTSGSEIHECQESYSRNDSDVLWVDGEAYVDDEEVKKYYNIIYDLANADYCIKCDEDVWYQVRDEGYVRADYCGTWEEDEEFIYLDYPYMFSSEYQKEPVLQQADEYMYVKRLPNGKTYSTFNLDFLYIA